MKTAISVEGELLEQADKTAKRMGVSRSRLFSLALQDYLTKRRQEEITAQLDRVYQEPHSESETRTISGMKAKFRRAVKDRW